MTWAWKTTPCPAAAQADWYGLNQYYIYTLSSQWAACVRAEWFRDQDGVAVVGPGNVPGVRAWAGHGFEGNFYELDRRTELAAPGQRDFPARGSLRLV